MADTLNQALLEASLLSSLGEEDDGSLVIDVEKRTIVLPTKFFFGVYNDKDVFKVPFILPRFYGPLDLSEFQISVNYLNSAGYGNVYRVEDAEITDDTIKFKWVTGRGVFVKEGTVRFIVCLRQLSETGEILKEFNTTIASASVLQGLEVDENPDPVAYSILANMEALEASTKGYKDTVQSESASLRKLITDTGVSLRAMVGAPRTAATAASMTDPTLIYVYTGNESDYTFGNWYYYNGTDFVSGGVYNSTAFNTDETLGISGAAADSAKVGEEISGLNEDLTHSLFVCNPINVFGMLSIVNVNPQGITYTKNADGTYTVSGTATATSFVDLFNAENGVPEGLKSGKYWLDITSNNVYLRIAKRTSGVLENIAFTHTSTFIDFTEDNLAAGMLVRLQVSSGTTVDETISITLTPFEKCNDALSDRINTAIYTLETEIQKEYDSIYTLASTNESGRFIRYDYAHGVITDIENANSYVTDYVDVREGDIVLVRGQARDSSVCYAIYDINKNPIYVYPETAQSQVTLVDFEKITIPKDGFYIRASGLAIANIAVYKKRVIDTGNQIEELKRKAFGAYWEDVYLENITSAYLNKWSTPTTAANCALSDYIPVIPNEDVLVTGKCADTARLLAFYDADKNYIGCYPDLSEATPAITATNLEIQIPQNAYFVRISAVYSTTIGIKKRLSANSLFDGNILAKKSLYCLGDSFTAGDFTGYVDADGKTGTDSDAYSHEYNSYKTYPYWIAYRNKMSLHNLAHIGWTVGHIVNHETYKQIPADADYAFINIGLNDNSARTPVGTIDDTDASTFYGGMNIILTWIRQNRPWLHFGIFIVSAYLGNQYRTALENLATKYGYPYLNMWTDSKVPAWMGKEGMDATLSAELTARATVSETNGHPNLDCHKFMSGFAEAFIRQI